MFFGPSIVKLLSSDNSLFVLCLSVGNVHNLGSVRSNELIEALKCLGVTRDCIIQIDHRSLKDGLNESWDSTIVKQIVTKTIEEKRIETVITFDEYGITKHSNHVAAYNA
ncbi:N-acetylglucosaminyl-phosphatidylinositol de-N-acetylase-like protein, partial [Dinothrombium tinctorium]